MSKVNAIVDESSGALLQPHSAKASLFRVIPGAINYGGGGRVGSARVWLGNYRDSARSRKPLARKRKVLRMVANLE